MAEVDNGDDPLVADARAAVETLARRADGVMHFVESYRQISRTPVVRRRHFEVLPWARELESLFRAGDGAEGVALSLEVNPDRLTLDADPDLMCQVLINLLRNAAEAAREPWRGSPPSPCPSPRWPAPGSRSRSPTTAPECPRRFARTSSCPSSRPRPKGTGVGLSLARQVVLAHRGSIGLGDSDSGGALFRILL